MGDFQIVLGILFELFLSLCAGKTATVVNDMCTTSLNPAHKGGSAGFFTLDVGADPISPLVS